ncbi:hypothetical protein ACQCN2_12730 [Brevibacillus ginsengisoli]|uniref:hypothetical protein n=1 Tax=Brevibacillus ginsengisoli TaxID=363854 RepID=UPI003CF5E433
MKKWLILLALSLVVSGCGDGTKGEKTKGEKTKAESAKTETKKESKKTKTETKTANPYKGLKGKNKDKAESNEKNAVVMKDMDTNKHDLVMFLNRAEKVFDDLQYAAATMTNGKKIKEDGITYRELPSSYDTKEKIITYFTRFWSRPIAVKMYDNLHTKVVNDKVYLAQGESEYHVLITVKNTTVEKDSKGITATVKDATLPAFSSDRTITYRLVRDQKTKQYEINQRLGTYGAKMFE